MTHTHYTTINTRRYHGSVAFKRSPNAYVWVYSSFREQWVQICAGGGTMGSPVTCSDTIDALDKAARRWLRQRYAEGLDRP